MFKVWLLIVFSGAAGAQVADPGGEFRSLLEHETGGRLKLSFEFRAREEARTGNNFGRSPNLENALTRTRIGAFFKATNWLAVSAMGQDARAPFYGPGAPATVRDSMDLHEAYVELFPERDRGFGAVAGRRMITYGDGNLIGVPNWTNVSRTYDAVRAYYRLHKATVEVLLVSPVKILPDSFNHPNLGDRVWGTYNRFPNVIPGGVIEGYVLRHDQNTIGGFTGTGRLGTRTFGGRANGPLLSGFKFHGELAVQNGHSGLMGHSGLGWIAGLDESFRAGRFPVDLLAEYKYASGTKQPGTAHDGTFDQLYPSNHDKFGHADLFGWRNIEDFRVLSTAHITRAVSVHLMYNNWWLASARDALYNSSGKSLAESPSGKAGRHIGQEADIFGVYRIGPYHLGAGFAHVFRGRFLKETTPGVNTRYLYVFETYSF
ncbi:MAG: alginate export family protein [Acidobacteriota bacterium]|nr:alginate export family protein [Acidobacteriota bacterium]